MLEYQYFSDMLQLVASQLKPVRAMFFDGFGCFLFSENWG
jgi:hypothetical protein